MFRNKTNLRNIQLQNLPIWQEGATLYLTLTIVQVITHPIDCLDTLCCATWNSTPNLHIHFSHILSPLVWHVGLAILMPANHRLVYFIWHSFTVRDQSDIIAVDRGFGYFWVDLTNGAFFGGVLQFIQKMTFPQFRIVVLAGNKC